MIRRTIAFCCLALSLAAAAHAARLTPERVPDPLKPWVGWALHGREMAACPPAFNDARERACAWPAELELAITDEGATFRLQVDVFAPDTPVALPGEAQAWPQEVRDGGEPVAVTPIDGAPALRLAPGAHTITGRFAWPTLPQNLLLPRATGVLRASLRGKPIDLRPEADGRLWLARPEQAQDADALGVRVYRLVEDTVPLLAGVRYELAVAGKPREIRLPLAVLPGFVPMAIDSALPARLDADGHLRLQARAGNWTIGVRARLMSETQALALPAAAAYEEVWSFQAHNEVRLVTPQGPPALDPKTLGVPAEWQGFPAYLLRPGATLGLQQTRRGEAGGEPDRLSLARRIWLDFSGEGYTVEDRITGTLSRSWRLEAAAPLALGRAAVDGQDQPITQLAKDGAAGIEVRRGNADVRADSRVESAARTLPVAGWSADISSFTGRLELPPGWRLLHVAGVDRAQGAWLGMWTLWDLFFAVLIVVAAARLFGIATGALFALALALTWHEPAAPSLPWLGLLAFHAIAGALPEGRLQRAARAAKAVTALVIVAMLLPYAVMQLRQAVYPALEMPYQQANALPGTPAAVPPEALRQKAEMDAGVASRESYALRDEGRSAARSPKAQRRDAPDAELSKIDPGARVQTGPGLPNWTWRTHQLVLQGPVASAQSLQLFLLPPWASALWALASVVLLALALWRCVGTPKDELLARLRRWLAPAAPVLVFAVAGPGAGGDAFAAAPPAATQPAPPAPVAERYPPTPPTAVLEELAERLTAPPACMPACAELARLALVADAQRIELRLEIHAQAEVAVPLPGQGARWRPAQVLADGRAAPLRRDAAGVLWLRLARGVHQVVMQAPAPADASLQIALPMAPRRLTSEVEGWTLAGVDARGLATGMLELARERTRAQADADPAAGRDQLPPFVRVERHVSLAQRWSVATRIVRVGPSLAPLTVRVPLLEGEGVTDAAVKVEGGEALVSLGAQAEAGFTSALDERARLRLVASRAPAQVEHWTLDVSPQWHVALAGIAPVHNRVGEHWLPTWMPWPGEEAVIEVAKPAGIDGRTLTLDGVVIRATPGRRASDVSAELRLRASRGGNHALQLPAGAQLLSVAIDGEVQPVRADGATVAIPVLPGAHTVKLDWRDSAGMAWRYRVPQLDLGAPAVNAGVELVVPNDRVVLAVGGPRLGPAVLIWGVLGVVLAAAWALARSRLAPLGFASWSLLGVGLAQASLAGALLIVGWFAVLAARQRYGASVSGWRFNAMQMVLALWTLFAVSTLFETLRTGLLGFPDLLVEGNGSSAFLLRWFQDRSELLTPAAEALSIPVFAYRLLMLAWALWLAASLLGWVRWAWECYTTEGYWRELKRSPRREDKPVDKTPGQQPVAPANGA